MVNTLYLHKLEGIAMIHYSCDGIASTFKVVHKRLFTKRKEIHMYTHACHYSLQQATETSKRQQTAQWAPRTETGYCISTQSDHSKLRCNREW